MPIKRRKIESALLKKGFEKRVSAVPSPTISKSGTVRCRGDGGSAWHPGRAMGTGRGRRMDASGGSAKPCCLIAALPIEIGVAPRQQQFLDPALLVVRADGVKRPSQVFLRIDAVEPAGFDQRCEDGPVTRGALVAGEQGVLVGRSHRPDGPPRELLSISMRPSPRNRVRPSQWWAKQARALPIGDFAGMRGWLSAILPIPRNRLRPHPASPARLPGPGTSRVTDRSNAARPAAQPRPPSSRPHGSPPPATHSTRPASGASCPRFRRQPHGPHPAPSANSRPSPSPFQFSRWRQNRRFGDARKKGWQQHLP